MNSEILVLAVTVVGFVILSAWYVVLMSDAAAEPERRSPRVLGAAHGAMIALALSEVALPIVVFAAGTLLGSIMVAVAITPEALRAGVRMVDWLVPYAVSAVLMAILTWPLIDVFRVV